MKKLFAIFVLLFSLVFCVQAASPSFQQVTNIVSSVTLSPQSSAVGEIQNAGLLPNLVDFASFTSFYLMSNTYAGNTIFFTNVSGFTTKGAYFTNGTSITFSENLSPTNTIIINWWEDYNNTNGVFGSLFQSVNTVNTNGEGFTYWGNTPPTGQDGQENVWGFGGGTLWPINASGYTNLVYGALGDMAAGFTFDRLQRHTTAISTDGHGHINVYEDGCLMSYYANTPNLVSFGYYPTNTMNLMVLGNYFSYCGIPSQFQHGLNGYIESIFMYNTILTTNLYEATVFASDWLQPHTARRIFVSDSLGTTPFSGANLPTLWNTLSGQEELPVNQNQGGEVLANFYTATNIINFFPPHGKVHDDIEVAGGINDVYTLPGNGMTIYTNLLLDFAPYFGQPGYFVDDWDINQTWTNSSVYPQTQTGWSNALVFDAAVYKSKQLFRHVYQRSQLITQEMLNTNRVPQFSFDGLHFWNLINGGTANLMVVGLTVQPDSGVNPLMPSNEVQKLFSQPNVAISVNSMGTNSPVAGSFNYSPNGIDAAWTPWSGGISSLNDVFYGGAGNINDTASGLTAEGLLSQTSISTGNGNCDSFGYNSLHNQTTGAEDEAFGCAALYNLTSAQQDIGIGYTALYYIQSSDYDIGIGFQALGNLGNGGDTGLYIKNIAIGDGAGLNNTTAQYDIYIGSSGVNGETSVTRIGQEGDTAKTILYGQIQPQAAFAPGGYVSTNGVGVSQSFQIQTNATGPHGWTLLITNGLIVGESPY